MDPSVITALSAGNGLDSNDQELKIQFDQAVKNFRETNSEPELPLPPNLKSLAEFGRRALVEKAKLLQFSPVEDKETIQMWSQLHDLMQQIRGASDHDTLEATVEAMSRQLQQIAQMREALGAVVNILKKKTCV